VPSALFSSELVAAVTVGIELVMTVTVVVVVFADEVMVEAVMVEAVKTDAVIAMPVVVDGEEGKKWEEEKRWEEREVLLSWWVEVELKMMWLALFLLLFSFSPSLQSSSDMELSEPAASWYLGLFFFLLLPDTDSFLPSTNFHSHSFLFSYHCS